MTVKLPNFTGADEAVVSPANSGFDAAEIDAGNTLRHDVDVKYAGQNTVRHNAAGGDRCLGRYDLSGNYIKLGLYLRMTGESTRTAEVIQIRADNGMVVQVQTRPGFSLRFNNDTDIVTSDPNVVADGAWARLEVVVNRTGATRDGVANGRTRLRLFTDPESSTWAKQWDLPVAPGSSLPTYATYGNVTGAGNANDMHFFWPTFGNEEYDARWQQSQPAEPPTIDPIIVTPLPLNEGETVTVDVQAVAPSGETITGVTVEQTGGPSVTLSSPTQGTRTFVVPNLDADAVVTLRAKATASNGLETPWATLSVPLTADPPLIGPTGTVATATPQTPVQGGVVQLGATAVEGDAPITGWDWIPPSGESLSPGTNVQNPTWDTTGKDPGDYSFTVRPTDGNGLQGPPAGVVVSVIAAGEHVGEDLRLVLNAPLPPGTATYRLVVQGRARGGGQLPAGTVVAYGDRHGIIGSIAPTPRSWKVGGDVNVDVLPEPEVDDTPPSVPTGLSATPTGTTSMNVDWDPSTDDVSAAGALIYHVYRDSSLVYTTNPGVTSFADEGLTPGTAYAYTAAAEDEAGNVSAQSSPVNATTDSDAPDPLRLLIVVPATPAGAPLQADIDDLEAEGIIQPIGSGSLLRLDSVNPVAVDDEANFDAVWITAGVSTSSVSNDYVAHALPVICSKSEIADVMGLADAQGGGSSARTNIKITNNSVDPLTTGLSLGSLTVMTTADNHEHLLAPVAGTVLATGTDADGENAELRWTLIQAGEALRGGLGNSPDIRMFLFWAPNLHAGTYATAAMRDILRRVFSYLQ